MTPPQNKAHRSSGLYKYEVKKKHHYNNIVLKHPVEKALYTRHYADCTFELTPCT